MAEDDSPRSGKKLVVNPNTILMPIGLVISIIVALWKGSDYLDSRFSQLVAADRAISEQLVYIKMNIAGRWTVTDMRLWASQLKIANPSLVVPDSMDVVRSDNIAGNDTRK